MTKVVAHLLVVSLFFVACSGHFENTPPQLISLFKQTCVIDDVNEHVVSNFNGKVFAIGDLHGDLKQTYRVLRLIGAIDARNKWMGECMVVVQVGDQIDRGPDDKAVLDELDRLVGDAKKHNSRLIVLNGNHELMNTQLKLQYASESANQAFTDELSDDKRELQVRIKGPPDRGSIGYLADRPHLKHYAQRASAFAPGAPYARLLAKRSFYAVVNDSVFVHGGITPEAIRYGLETFNEELVLFFNEGREPNKMMIGENGPFWTRAYSDPANVEPLPKHCAMLSETLGLMRASRMVVGHTIQDSINSACGNKVWRIDVGMSSAYGETQAQVLEILGNTARVISAWSTTK